jgi:DnaJ-class molecular chaperone
MANSIGILEARTILNVDSSASEKDIKTAYRKLALEHHPDRGGDAHKFSRIQEAYTVLSTNRMNPIMDHFNSIEKSVLDDIFGELFNQAAIFFNGIEEDDEDT